jgi:hypothetical protein
VDYPVLGSPTVVWTGDIAAAGPICTAGQLRVFDDHIYVSGHTDDSSKPPITGGGYWQSGMAARLTLDGAIDWMKFLRHGNMSDVCDMIVPTADAAYFVGVAEHFVLSQSKDLFGYGWVEKLAPATGDPIASFTAGSDAYESGFNTAQYEGGALTCGGWTNGEVSGGTYRGWYVGLDVSAPAILVAPTKLTAAARPAAAGRIGDVSSRRDNAR